VFRKIPLEGSIKPAETRSINLLKKILKEVNLTLAIAVSVDIEEISEHGFKDAQLQCYWPVAIPILHRKRK